MKLVMAILSKSDAPVVAGVLAKQGYPSTITNSIGGFMHKENAILFSGVDDTKVRYVTSIISEATSGYDEQGPEMGAGGYIMPDKIKVGGATVFVLDVEQFIRL